MLKVFYAILLMVFQTTLMDAQMLSPATIGTLGTTTTIGDIMIEDHLGSLQINIYNTPTFMYTQGFIQPDGGTTTTIPPINDVVFDGDLYLLNVLGTTLIYDAETSAPLDDTYLELAVGELASKSLMSGNDLLTQGVLQPYDKKYWTGVVNSAWHNRYNWSPAFIPTKYDQVVIPDSTPHDPFIYTGIIGECKQINLETGSNLTLELGGILKVK